MSKDAQIGQLIDAVSRHPGSPAFALLVEHHLDQGDVDRALDVGRAGFNANPGYERGAVAYLTALRRSGDPRSAGEVFGKAVAYLPRSAGLRLQWAMTLAEAGRDQEARRYAREALNLDPLSRDARALVATLGDAATPLGGTQEYVAPPVAQEEDLTDELDQLFEDGDDIGEEDQLGPAASLSEQARAQRAAVRPRVRPIGQRTTPHSLFDLTPGPMSEDSRYAARARASKGSPFDITPMPLPRAQQDPAANERPAATPPPPPPPPLAPPPPTNDLAGAVVEPRRPAPDVLKELPQFRSRRWRWIVPLLLLLMVGAAAGGYLYYLRVQDRRLGAHVTAALAQTRPDRADSYSAARRRLTGLLQDHPEDPRVLAALALVNAHMAARLGGDAGLAQEARQMLSRRNKEKQGADSATAARVLLAVRENATAKARALVAKPGNSWHLLLGKILVAEPAERVRLADGMVTAPDQHAPAVLYEAARVLRLAGRPADGAKLAEAGLRASPAHPGLQIEKALATLSQGRSVTAADSICQAAEATRFAPAAELLRARILAARGKTTAARKRAAAASRLDPDSPEIGVLFGRLLLRPGGDASQALPLLQRHAPALSAYDPAQAMPLVVALARTGRPHEARKVLGEIDVDRLKPAVRQDILALRVRCAHLADDTESLAQMCKQPGGPLPLLACVEALLERSKLEPADDLARGLRGRAVRRYVAGLRALSVGDSGRARKRLERLATAGLPDPVAPRLALAASMTDQGSSQDAVEILRAAVVQDARSVRSRVALARSLVAAGHDTEAKSLLVEVLRAKPTQPSVLARAGDAFLGLGLPRKALQLIQHGIKYNADSSPIKILAGRVALANNQLDQARTMFTEVLKQAPDSPEALLPLGRIEVAAGRRGEARKYFARALELRPRDPELLLQLATLQGESGDHRAALPHGVKAVRLFRESNQTQRTQEALVVLGRAFRKGDAWARARAEELLFEATKAKKAPPSAFLELGLLYQQRGDHNRAVWCFRQAVEKDPSFADGHLQLGLSLMRKRRWRADAKRAFQTFLGLRPKGKEAKRVRGLLRRLR